MNLYAAKLHELLHSSFNLPNAVVDLGRIELGPSEIKDATHRIYEEEHTQRAEHEKRTGIDAKAHYLLATSGFNAEQVLGDIALIDFAKPKEVKRESKNRPNLIPFADGQGGEDKAAFDARVSANFDEIIARQLNDDWTARKRQLFELLGPDAARSGKGSKQPPRASPLVGTERPGQRVLGRLAANERPQFTPLMRAYGEVVTALCDAGLVMPDIVSRFAACGAAKSLEMGYLQDSWRALEVNNPQKFLEVQYREFIDAEIRAHRQDAKLGGVPSSFAKIKSFVALKYLKHNQWDAKLTLVNKTPIWAYLYYLVRAGYLEEAQQLVLERKDIFETIGSSFALYFKAWVESPQHELSPHYTEMIHSEFHQLSRQQHTDPYKLALYKVIGRCDLFKRTLPQVAVTTEDWLWLQLVLSREGSQYTFADVQKYVQSMGSAHLAPGVPAKYFTILVVLKLYKQAVQFLRAHDETHAVHFAIALWGLEEKANKDNDFLDLVGHYTRFFRNNMPTLAVDYLALAATSGALLTAAHEALQELVLETGKYSLLLGDVQAFTDKPIRGYIEKRQELFKIGDHKAYRAIALGAANKAYEDGRVVDAILLYRLAEERSRVLQLVNTQLGLLLSGVQLGQPVNAAISSGFDILQLARNIMRIDGDALAKTPTSRETCLVLLAIADCLDLLAQHEWQPCLERLGQTGLLVLSPEPAVNEVVKLSQQFLAYDECISRNIPNVLLMALTCILHITETLMQQGPSVASRLIDQYRGRASNCMVYAGLIEYRMPREVYKSLTEKEAELNCLATPNAK